MERLFNSSFMPHGHCFFWQQDILSLHVISDSLIALSYLLIPFLIVRVARKRPDLIPPPILYFFATFIFFCGLTHAMTIWNFWNADYWASGSLKGVTALISVTAGAVTFRYLPRILQLPNPEEHAAILRRMSRIESKINSLPLRWTRRQDLTETFEQIRTDMEHFKHEEAKLRKLTQEQSRFLASVSHEMRTPLNAVSGYIDKLMLEMPANEPYWQDLRVIKVNTDFLNDLIGDILDLARLEKGTVEPDDLEFSMDDMLAEIKDLVGKAAINRQNWFQLKKIGPIPQSICTDPLRLKQILLNLIFNANKHTESGIIRLQVMQAPSLTKEQAQLEFRVIDTGVGIPQDAQKSIFELFSQHTRTSQNGLGLGLALAKHLAHLLGGQLILERSSPKKGACFLLRLPVRLPVESTRSRPIAKDDIKKISSRLAALRPKIENKSILIVEDSVVSRQMMQFFLQKLTPHVATAGDGQQALQLVDEKRFDLILMDLHLPGADGITVGREILSRHRDIPIIAVTANALISEKQKCAQAGFCGFLTKPLSLPEFCRTVDELFSAKSSGSPSISPNICPATVQAPTPRANSQATYHPSPNIS